jgi:ABC-type multidrug transport system permease subunit
MLKRIYAIFRARNLEFARDRGSLSWNIILPVSLMFGLSFIFSSDRAEYTVGVLQADTVIDNAAHPFLESRYIDFIVVADRDSGFRRIARHQLDLMVEFGDTPQYWINPDSPKGYFVEFALLQADEQAGGTMTKSQVEGDPVRYVDWVLPGILGMNIMFSSLFGVGYVVVRYRKNGFLKRLRATPLRAIEFVIAQVASRLVLILIITSFVYTGTTFFLDIRMDGSYLLLLAVLFAGSISMISMGLMVTWPMMMLSGVWFSLEAASDWVRQVAAVFPLTHMLDAARAVMLDGAGLTEVMPEIVILLGMSVIFLAVGAFGIPGSHHGPHRYRGQPDS